MKVQIDRDVLVWLHKQPRNVFLTVLSAILGLVSDPADHPRGTRRGAGRRPDTPSAYGVGQLGSMKML
ncbi:hypothetical protein O7628_09700 [Micromonospora sp. WMMD956]|uniref:hypothetical protein n=1 Tax=Micromonospora TaxID=1873 RepID=UPI0024177F70|nr:hypothetical protein [Micromonospora sp. WMMD956]MDG4815780.1 hypothetical protein [Micromonospora sp. WMMD956]